MPTKKPRKSVVSAPVTPVRPLYFWMAVIGSSTAIFLFWLALLPGQLSKIKADMPAPPRWQALDDGDTAGKLKDSLGHIGESLYETQQQMSAGIQTPEAQALLDGVVELSKKIEAESSATTSAPAAPAASPSSP